MAPCRTDLPAGAPDFEDGSGQRARRFHVGFTRKGSAQNHRADFIGGGLCSHPQIGMRRCEEGIFRAMLRKNRHAGAHPGIGSVGGMCHAPDCLWRR